MEMAEANVASERILERVSEAVITDETVLENVLLSVFAKGHVLLEDVPGTGKTLTAQSVAGVLGLSFSRIQFTPDLLPTDITGTHIYNERDQSFEFQEGPIFANVILADEINRAPPKTQSALLEAMDEQQVTIEGETRTLPDPFFVIATQNPIEMEGTFELPEAQIDRFLIKDSLGYPEKSGELEILHRRLSRDQQLPTVSNVISTDQIRRLQSLPETVHVDEGILEYLINLVRATREDARVAVGVSPRGTQRFLEAVRARAVMRGRDFVKPDDIKRVAGPVLAHRLVLTPDAALDDVDPRGIINELLTEIPVPTVD